MPPWRLPDAILRERGCFHKALTPSVTANEIQTAGVDEESARRLAEKLTAAWRDLDPGSSDSQVDAWLAARALIVAHPDLRWNFGLHLALYRLVYRERRPAQGPGPAWVPTPQATRGANTSSLMDEVGIQTYPELHRWSVAQREAFWTAMLRRLRIRFRSPPQRILDPNSDPTTPAWLPGASLNIAESCFAADAERTAIVYGSEEGSTLTRTTYGALRRLANRVANGLEDLGVARGERVALYLPMTPESVAIYLGTILAGRCVVGIADTSAPEDFAKRARIGGVKAVFTIRSYRRDGTEVPIYEKLVIANGPTSILLAQQGNGSAAPRRPHDLPFEDFLGGQAYDAVPCAPSDPTNILFSSGTTKDPKAIVWTHTTPIKSAADGHLHHDVRESDVLAWPTSFGWMMGPWLTYASLVNRATMALYVGAPTRRAFGEFVEGAGITMLGVVPKLVRAWMAGRTMEGLDWRRIRLFSSTAEPSTPEEMLYLMFLAGYRPVVEYCGGTEVGGGYITGTILQPCAPGTFTTPTLGLDFMTLEEGRPADRGEVFLVPPSIGLSNALLNYDHFDEYYEGVPRGPNGELLRRHGDQIERLGGGYYRHHGRIDDVININGVKTSAEEIRSVIGNEAVYDTKPVAVDVDGSGQHVLVVYAVPRDPSADSVELRTRLTSEFQRSIKERLSPLLAHVHDVVLVLELPQAGPGKTRTMKDLQSDYRERTHSR